MSHDATKCLLGTTGSSDRHVTVEPADPATFLAGLAVRRKSDEGLSLSSSDGQLIGVSLGISQSDTTKTAVCRAGNYVPLRIDDVELPVVGEAVTVSNSTGMGSASGTATGAKYVSGAISGIDPITGAEVDVALIDMVGGL